MLTEFQNPFTNKLSSKFQAKQSLIIPSHLKCIATLPCEIVVFKNCKYLDLREENRQKRLGHWKHLVK